MFGIGVGSRNFYAEGRTWPRVNELDIYPALIARA
jgi:hypothetical protein